MNKKSLSMRMRDNYSTILNKLTPEERAWAEKFEEMEYSLERGREDQAIALYQDLKGSTATKSQAEIMKEEAAAKERCNPTFADAQQRYEERNKATRRKTTQVRIENRYDPSDFIDQRFNAAGYELAVTTNPEDAIIEAIDAAKAANTTLSDLLDGNTMITKPRGKGRPRKVAADE